MTTLIYQCCQCRRVAQTQNQEYVEASPLPGVKVSHGYCPDCFRIAMEELIELGFAPECHTPELTVTNDPQVAARLIAGAREQEAA